MGPFDFWLDCWLVPWAFGWTFGWSLELLVGPLDF